MRSCHAPPERSKIAGHGEQMEEGRTARTPCRPPRLAPADRPVSGLTAGPGGHSHRLPTGESGSGCRETCVMRLAPFTVAGAVPALRATRAPASRLARDRTRDTCHRGQCRQRRRRGQAAVDGIRSRTQCCAMANSARLDAALAAAAAAAEIIRNSYRRNIEVRIKADRSPVTEADVAAEAAIRSGAAGPISAMTASTARNPPPSAWTRNACGSWTRSTAPSPSCADTRCSRRRSR